MTIDVREENAVIESTFLGIDDHGLLAQICFDYGGSGQCLRFWPEKNSDDLDHFMRRILEIFGVDTWERLKGRPCKVRHTWTNVLAISSFLNDDFYFLYQEQSKTGAALT